MEHDIIFVIDDMQQLILPIFWVDTALGLHNIEHSLSKMSHIPWYYANLPVCN